jgi:hypothetical protein
MFKIMPLKIVKEKPRSPSDLPKLHQSQTTEIPDKPVLEID